jgi:15-cis-phytoene synthase
MMGSPQIYAPSALVSAQIALATKGRSFYWASHFLGSAHAERATRLYGFCRYIDDLADEAASPHAAKTDLAFVKSAILSGASLDPVVSDAISLMRECQIDPAIAVELIKGVESDLDEVKMDTEEDLLRYCYRVAGTVGLMMCGVLDVRDSKAYAHAIDLGIAMQLTNICRDVQEDAANGRRYIPASLVGNIKPITLVNPPHGQQPLLQQSLKALLDLADLYYRSGERGLAYLPAAARMGIWIASRVYREIGVKLRQRGYHYWNGRVKVSGSRKALITVLTVFSQPLMVAYWHPRGGHETSLHDALYGLPCVTAPHGGGAHE